MPPPDPEKIIKSHGRAIPTDLVQAARLDIAEVFKLRETTRQGLSQNEARQRLSRHGPNELQTQKLPSWRSRLGANAKDPLSLLLVALGLVSVLTGDIKATIIIAGMLLLSVVLRFVQERRADLAVEKLKAMVHTTATVFRAGQEIELPLIQVVPGDVVALSAGDMVPADVRIIESRDLFINQASLTGESLPVDKHAAAVTAPVEAATELSNTCFMGTNVESGTGLAVVLATGRATLFGELASSLSEKQEVSAFDRGVGRFTWLMIRFIGVMVPMVFLINGFSKGDWLQAFLFAVAVAVGLTPELLPMIVTVNLSKGALDMSRKKVIVKRLNALQNVGAMDVLCTDKTGTLTEGRVTLIQHVDIEGKKNETVLAYAFLNSSFQTGLKNLMDAAVLKQATDQEERFRGQYKKIDEVPFDFLRRRMSVVVQGPDKRHLLICKGAVEEVIAQCQNVIIDGRTVPLQALHHEKKQNVIEQMSADGFRLIALATRDLPPEKTVYTTKDESGLTLLGFLAFLDPPKASAGEAIATLQKDGVAVKILTGDNELVTRKICADVGLAIKRIILGSEIDALSDDELGGAAEEATVFDKLEPAHKVRVIKTLQARGHVVGFLGDGINDAPALKAADVGTSVDTATDIARDSSDVILLEKSLSVLHEAILDGRKVFGNIVKYIKMTASSNFGNMFSVLGASIFLPFLPMLPLQIIINNLLYDFSQVTIPTDNVDSEFIARPRKWNISSIGRYILYIGPVSSLFDYATFFLMLFVFHAATNPALFHTGWFVESLASQTLIIYIIRTNRIPFLQSRASKLVMISTLLVVGIGALLPFSPLANALGFTPLPPTYWLYLSGMLALYFMLAQLMKTFFLRRYGTE